jgi:hypothetical protein
MQAVQSQFDHFMDSELEAELARYRDHIIRSVGAINAEIAEHAAASKLSVYFDTTARDAVANELLLQCALYYDHAIVDDPLFRLTAPQSDQGKVMGQYLGFNPGGVDRKRLAEAVGAMLEARPMVAAGFLVYAPISVLHEPPQQLPLLYSETLHAERVPEALRAWMRERVEVHPLQRSDDGYWYHRDGDPLVPARGIVVSFPEHPQKGIYFLSEAQVIKAEGNRVEFVVQHLPETPPAPHRFSVWVEQSINLRAPNKTATRVIL